MTELQTRPDSARCQVPIHGQNTATSVNAIVIAPAGRRSQRTPHYD